MPTVVGQTPNGDSIYQREDGSTFVIPGAAFGGPINVPQPGVAGGPMPDAIAQASQTLGDPPPPPIQSTNPFTGEQVTVPHPSGPRSDEGVVDGKLEPLKQAPQAPPPTPTAAAPTPAGTVPEVPDDASAQELSEQALGAQTQVDLDGAAMTIDHADQIAAQANADRARTDEYLVKRQNELDAQQAQYAADVQEMRSAKPIDGNRLWNEASTGRKAMGAIGLMLGGALIPTVGRNPALDSMNSMMDRDLKGQIAEAQRKQGVASASGNLYDQLLSRYGDERTAMALWQTAAWSQLEKQMQAGLARLGPARVKADHLKQLAEIRGKAEAAAAEGQRWLAEFQQKRIEHEDAMRQKNADRALDRRKLGEDARQFDARLAFDKEKHAQDAERERQQLAAKLAEQRGIDREKVSFARGLVGETDENGHQFIVARDKQDRETVEGKVLSANNALDAANEILDRGVGRELPGSEVKALNDAELAAILTGMMENAKGVLSDKDMRFYENQFGDVNKFLKLTDPETREKVIRQFALRVERAAREKVAAVDPRYGYKYEPNEEIRARRAAIEAKRKKDESVKQTGFTPAEMVEDYSRLVNNGIEAGLIDADTVRTGVARFRNNRDKYNTVEEAIGEVAHHKAKIAGIEPPVPTMRELQVRRTEEQRALDKSIEHESKRNPFGRKDDEKFRTPSFPGR